MMTWFIKPGKYIEEQVGGEKVMTFYYHDELPEPYVAEFHAEPQTWQVFRPCSRALSGRAASSCSS
jgi:hypothetical protein